MGERVELAGLFVVETASGRLPLAVGARTVGRPETITDSVEKYIELSISEGCSYRYDYV